MAPPLRASPGDRGLRPPPPFAPRFSLALAPHGRAPFRSTPIPHPSLRPNPLVASPPASCRLPAQPAGLPPRLALTVSYFADGARLLDHRLARRQVHSEDSEVHAAWAGGLKPGQRARHALLPVVHGWREGEAEEAAAAAAAAPGEKEAVAALLRRNLGRGQGQG